jgi:hypothetical protein
VVEGNIVQRHVRRRPNEEPAAEACTAATIPSSVAALRQGVCDSEVLNRYVAGNDGKAAIGIAAVQRVAAAINGKRNARLQRERVNPIRLASAAFGNVACKIDLVGAGCGRLIDLLNRSVQASLIRDVKNVGRGAGHNTLHSYANKLMNCSDSNLHECHSARNDLGDHPHNVLIRPIQSK